MAERGRFKYEGRSVEEVTRRSKQAGGAYDSYIKQDITMYKPKEGECQVRILPPTWTDKDKWGRGWEVGVHVHYGIGSDENTYLCLDKMKGEPCPICEARRKSNDEDEADALRVSWRGLAWVIDRDNERAGPMLWSMPISLFREINNRSVDKKTNAAILIDDPDNGYDLMFNREGSGLRTKYTGVEVDRDPSPMTKNDDRYDQWLDYIEDNPLPEILNFYDAEYLEKQLFGKSRRRDDGDGEGGRGSRRGEEDTGRRSRRGEEEERPRSRRGDPEPEPEESRSSRRRGEEEAPTEERTGRRRAAEEPEDTSRARRRAAAAEEEADERPSRRRAAEPEEPPFDEDKGEEERPSRRRLAEPEKEEEPEERPARRRAAEPAEEEEERPTRRRAAPADEDAGESASDTARRSLGRMREGRR